MNVQVEQNIQKAVFESYSNPSLNIFDRFIDLCQTHYDRPVHSITELRERKNTKTKGDIFEYFCLKYLKCCCNMQEVWLLQDIPNDILSKLNLKRYDMGIDIISLDSNDKFHAVQAKYRKKNKYKAKSGMTWKQLSTFYALVNRSGPYHKHVVMTNADYVRHVGKKTRKDQSICLGTLRNISKEKWLLMANMHGHTLSE